MTQTVVRAVLPSPLRVLAQVGAEISVDVVAT